MIENRSAQSLSPKSAEPDLALIYFGSLFETLRQAPESHESALDALAGHIILNERPKTKLGLAVQANACRYSSVSRKATSSTSVIGGAEPVSSSKVSSARQR